MPYLDKDADEIEYGLLHGYRLPEKEGVEAAFPFGFGLSYTSFTYGVLRLEAAEITEDDVIRVAWKSPTRGYTPARRLCSCT